jgi:hypothetical protein
MASLIYDLRYLQTGAEILEIFLLSQDVYWPVGIQAPPGEAPYPQLSLGGLALAQARAQVHVHTPDEAKQLQWALEQIDGTHQQWRGAWGNKAAREISARLNQWRTYLEDYREHPQANYDRYGYEVFRRVIIALLMIQTDGMRDAEQEMLHGLDALVKALLAPGEFIWETDLERAFPRDPFWYLYGLLPKEIAHAIK